MKDQAPVVCASYWNMLDANIAKGRLQAEGIPAFLDNEHFVTADWFVNIFVGGIRVLVPPSYAVQAAEVIKRIELGEFELDEWVAIEPRFLPLHDHQRTPHGFVQLRKIDWRKAFRRQKSNP